MHHQTLQKIHCESTPIFSGFDGSKEATCIFLHRFPEQGVDNADIRYCSIHINDVATVQCIECVKNGLPVKNSYYCSNKCFQDAWKNHCLDHRNEIVSNSCNEDAEARGNLNRFDFWSPADMVLRPDKIVEEFIKRQFETAVYADETFVTDPVIQSQNLLSPSLCWIPDSLNTDITEVGNITVLTYNMLSEIYVYPHNYPHCPKEFLEWKYRGENLLHELIQYDADILCLQEVQIDHFVKFFKPKLESFGYSAVYKSKNNMFYTGSGYTIDGCATFYRNDKFNEVESYQLEYGMPALSLMEKLEPSLRKQATIRLVKDNVALAVILEVVGNSAQSAASSSKFCVVNTHIYAGRGFPDVKLLQVSNLVNEIEKTIDPRMPLFICGDMNSHPGSDPYVLLTERAVDIARAQAPDPLRIFQHLKLHHSMQLASAYSVIRAEPLTTLDYIFYTEDSMEVDWLLDLPDFESMGIALPSNLWSSDHIALMGSFRITKPYYGEVAHFMVHMMILCIREKKRKKEKPGFGVQMQVWREEVAEQLWHSVWRCQV